MPNEYVPLQQWSCDKCLGRGDVESPPRLTYDELMLRIHDRHIEMSPNCAMDFGVTHVRLAQTAPLPD